MKTFIEWILTLRIHLKVHLFDFYLDFIGYTTNRNLKEQEKWEKEKIGGSRNYSDRYKAKKFNKYSQMEVSSI